jgi:serine/threonine protein phosphatase PrpC
LPLASQEEDIESAPTQILSPQEMVALHARRWQQESGTGSVGGPPEARAQHADVPGVLAVHPSDIASSSASQDVLNAPVVPMTQPEHGAAPEGSEPLLTSPGLPGITPSGDEALPATSQVADRDEGDSNDSSGVSSGSPVQEGEPVTAREGEQVEQQSQPVNEDTQSAAAPTNFPAQPVGTTLIGRYEITQVISEGEQEHVYQVVDHQGYQQCWNCASQQNAEGDEFCIDCGARLLDVTYVVHEYAPEESKESESHVLQGTIVNTFMDAGHTFVVELPQATQNAFPNGVHLLAASDSDAGNVRRAEPNEDSTLVLQLQRVHESHATPEGVFIVADGMGGHDNGQGASRMAINVIAERMVRELFMTPLASEKTEGADSPVPPAMDEDSLVELLQGAVEDANTAICQVNQRDKTDMGSTITGFMIVRDHTYILNVGDSRTYIQRDGKLYRLTNDHSLVGQLVAGGLIEPDDVYTHPQRSQIFRSLGDKPNVQIDIFKQQVHPGDILLSCSDGLWEMVRDPQITEILNNAPDPQLACVQLIEAANANGGEDNVSAVVVFVR